MRRYLVGLVATLALLLPMASPAGAIRYGSPDGEAHPYVGLAVFYIDGVPQWRCTGTLIAPTVFLTAGHCTYGATSAQVWFDEHVTQDTGYPYEGGITGTPYTYSVYEAGGFPDTGDVGYVILDTEVTDRGYGVVADVGTLDAMATKRGRQSTTFDVVGYGLQEVKPREMAERSRLWATVQLVNLRSALTDGYNIHYSNAPGTGGGTCFGDSGGPVFLQGTNIIVAVNSFVLNENCAGAGFAYRVDTSDVHAFLGL